MSARTMSPDLIAFLKAWHDWATNGAPEGKPFIRQFGLCTNCRNEFGEDAWESLTGTLEEEFGDSCDPFGYDDYRARNKARTQHECPKRLAWVRERLVEAGVLRNCDDCDFFTTEQDATVCPDRACRGSVA